MKKIILFGATGQQGGAIAKKLIQNGNHIIAPIRAIEKKSILNEMGVEAIVSDFSIASITEIIRLGNAVVLQVPVIITPKEMIEFTGKTLTAIKAAGNPHTVFNISSVIPQNEVGLAGPDARLKMKQLAQNILPTSIVLSSTLYLENFSQAYRQAIEQGGVIPQALPAEIPVAYLSFEDLATYVSAALEREDLQGHFIPIGGSETLTGIELSQKLGALLGKHIHYQAITPQELSEFLTPMIGETTAFQVAEMYSWEGGPGSVLLNPDVKKYQETLGVKLPTFDEWATTAFNISK